VGLLPVQYGLGFARLRSLYMKALSSNFAQIDKHIRCSNAEQMTRSNQELYHLYRHYIFAYVKRVYIDYQVPCYVVRTKC